MQRQLHMPGLRAPAVRYTRRVSFLRIILWMLVTFTISALVWIASDNSSSESGIRVVFSNIPKSENLQNIMVQPHYQGVDGKNNPYTVMADQAIQLDKENVALEKVRGDMTTGKSAWVAINADKGQINITTKQLELNEHVNMFYEGGYEFRSNHAHIDIQNGSAYGDLPIEGQGPPGTLTADRFEISEHGAVIRFKGSVKMTLYR
jgi:lipopolysaccharide export system protein LptC